MNTWHLRAGEEVDEVAGGASGMDVDKIGEICDRASEGQAAGVYGTGFTAGSLAKVGARDRTWVLGIEVGSDINSIQSIKTEIGIDIIEMSIDNCVKFQILRGLSLIM